MCIRDRYISSRLPILTQEFGTRGYQLEDRVSCLTFTFDNLLECLDTAVKLSAEERQTMADSALSENEADISMLAAVKNYLAEST